MSIISIYKHLKSDFPKKQHPLKPWKSPNSIRVLHTASEGKAAALTREWSTAASHKSSFREMCSGCTCGFRQQWELGQDLWLRTRFYLGHWKLGGASDTAVQEEKDTAQALPTAMGRLQCCMRTVEFRSSFSRRQKTPELLWMLHTASVSS